MGPKLKKNFNGFDRLLTPGSAARKSPGSTLPAIMDDILSAKASVEGMWDSFVTLATRRPIGSKHRIMDFR